MTTLLGGPKVQYFKTGTVDYLAGGKLYSYAAGTSTPLATYPTVLDALAATNANTNPIILDSRGEADVVVKGSTKLILKDANDNVIWTVDNVDAANTDILDSEGNEVLKFVGVSSAVNEWTITNAAAGGNVIFAATGGDTNISGIVRSKGSDPLYLDGGTSGDLELNSTATGTIRLRRDSAVTGTLAVSGNTTVGGTLAVTGATTLTGTTNVNGANTLCPAGTVAWFAGTSVPSNWLECAGAAVSRTTYAALFAAIGTTWGAGDGSTTFNLPNQARRTIVGRGGSGTATLASTVGSTGGSETHTLVTAEIPSHAHSYLIPQPSGVGSSPNSINAGTPGGTQNTGSTGGDGAHNNMQPSMVMMMMIRAI